MGKLYVGDFSFDWDDRKNKANIKKHGGLNFELAVMIWLHPDRVLDIVDQRFDYGEERWIAIGTLPQDERFIVVVAYCDRHDEIRIISARYAEPGEERAYRRRFHKG